MMAISAGHTRSFRSLGVRKIAIELNNNCNFRCMSCPVSLDAGSRKTKMLDLDFVKKVFDEIKEDGSLECVILNFFGEPLLYPYLPEVLAYSKDNKVKIRFGTNAYLLNDKIIKTLMEYPPDEIVISIQHFNKDSIGKMKGVEIDYNKWLTGVAAYIKAHMETGCGTLVQLSIGVNPYHNALRSILGLGTLDVKQVPYDDPSFRADLDKFIGFFVKEKLEMDLGARKSVKGNGNPGYMPYFDINDKISFCLKKFSNWHKFYGHLEAGQIDCVTDHVVINADRNLLLCCMDHSGGTKIGQIAGGDIKRVIGDNHDILVNKHNMKSRFEICRKCKGAPTLRGVFLTNACNLLKRYARKCLKRPRNERGKR